MADTLNLLPSAYIAFHVRDAAPRMLALDLTSAPKGM